jgi:drug/metabolite transporter (DMT)-like permease
MAKTSGLAISGLLTGALVWGLIWYPYRILEEAGVSGAPATLATYAVALIAAVTLFHRDLHRLRRIEPILAAIALTAGWTNLAYVLGMIHGQVMQVLLLFYLAPLWTLLIARVLLGERAGAVGALLVVLSLAGAAIMLWEQTGWHLPIPHSVAEWLGLSSGVTFALSNVLIRKAHQVDIRVKSVAVFGGVALVAMAVVPMDGASFAEPIRAGLPAIALLVLLGLVIFATNLAVQHGLTGVGANQAIVLLLSELVVAAVSSYFLAGEAMRWNQWVGGAMIVTASLLSGRLAAREAPSGTQTLQSMPRDPLSEVAASPPGDAPRPRS